MGTRSVQTLIDVVQRLDELSIYQEKQRCATSAYTNRGLLAWLGAHSVVLLGMANTANSCAGDRPGPKPIFTARVVVKLRPDQYDAVKRVAAVLGLTGSDVIRWFIDEGTRAVETTPNFNTLERSNHGDAN